MNSDENTDDTDAPILPPPSQPKNKPPLQEKKNVDAQNNPSGKKGKDKSMPIIFCVFVFFCLFYLSHARWGEYMPSFHFSSLMGIASIGISILTYRIAQTLRQQKTKNIKKQLLLSIYNDLKKCKNKKEITSEEEERVRSAVSTVLRSISIMESEINNHAKAIMDILDSPIKYKQVILDHLDPIINEL